MTSIVWAEDALVDLADIVAYIGRIDVRAADRVVGSVRASVRRLADFPYSGERLGRSEARKLSVAGYPYLVIYQIAGDAVVILQVRHAARDWRPR